MILRNSPAAFYPVALCVLILAPFVSGRPSEASEDAACAPEWLPTFGSLPGADNDVHAFALHDDGTGSGSALYAGGSFQTIGGAAATYVAKWDGTAWSTLGAGTNGAVHALASFDDGSGGGPALYAAGFFTAAGGAPASYVAKWDGNAWSPVGGGLNSPGLAFAVHDDGLGGGPALFVGGSFTTANNSPAQCIAKWDGSRWAALGAGMTAPSPANARVDALVEFQGRLVAGGLFEQAGGVTVNHVAAWDGVAWSPLGIGVAQNVVTTWPPNQAWVSAFAVFDDGLGGGPALHVGGFFSEAGGNSASNAAHWDGSTWSPLGDGLDGAVHGWAVHDDGSGTGMALYAGGSFQTAGGTQSGCVARWDGTAWSTLVSSMQSSVRALVSHDDGSGAGARLVAGGDFVQAGGLVAHRIAAWDGAAWEPLTRGLNARVDAVLVHDDGLGGGSALYAGGQFTDIGGMAAGRIAKWDGATWSTLGSGLNGEVRALGSYDDGNGPALYAAGPFTLAGGAAANRIAKWNGTAWFEVGGGVNATTRAMTVFDDGSGPALFIGGHFTLAGGAPANRIAKWDGSSWSSLGSGIDGPSQSQTHVEALAVYDDGTGDALFVAGRFQTAGGVTALHIARWDGLVWSEVGGGIMGTSVSVHALEVHDDGAGGGLSLYLGGGFDQAGGFTDLNGIAKWNGSTWAPVGGGVSNDVRALATFDDGSGTGPSLYAGGYIFNAGGVVAGPVARWDGTAWSPLGVASTGHVSQAVEALAVFHTPEGSSLVAAGTFVPSPAGDSFMARWGCPPPGAPGVAYCYGDGSGTPCPCANTGAAGEGCANSTGGGATLAASGRASVASDDLSFGAGGMPSQAALLFAGTTALNGGNGIPFGDGLRCAGGNSSRLGVRIADLFGEASWGPGLASLSGWSAGDTRHFQVWYRDPVNGPCSSGSNQSNAYTVVFAP